MYGTAAARNTYLIDRVLGVSGFRRVVHGEMRVRDDEDSKYSAMGKSSKLAMKRPSIVTFHEVPAKCGRRTRITTGLQVRRRAVTRRMMAYISGENRCPSICSVNDNESELIIRRKVELKKDKIPRTSKTTREKSPIEEKRRRCPNIMYSPSAKTNKKIKSKNTKKPKQKENQETEETSVIAKLQKKLQEAKAKNSYFEKLLQDNKFSSSISSSGWESLTDNDDKINKQVSKKGESKIVEELEEHAYAQVSYVATQNKSPKVLNHSNENITFPHNTQT
ncbi:uncharacterized protein LOC118645134 [Monomorium pharaonis]|uniref:uncharacterized protein LOC118645134 n=1 Tax=Monomorium pharaonis TaxID=307658 RepID=UPI0017469339|nr:uncharacterized protein LOC118645134 [Monomorium pharaonis]